MKFSNILNVSLLALISRVSAAALKDHFLDNCDRAELFTMTDYNVPDIYINMGEDEFDALIYSASVNALDMSGDVPPPPPPADMPENGGEGGQEGPEGQDGPGGPGGPAGEMPPEFAHLVINPGTEEEQNLKITDASLKFVLDGKTTEISSVSISVGGDHSRNTPKVSFNLKCNKGKLFGRKVFRLRSNDSDPSLMRSKISCDIVNHLGYPTISANYARVYINDEFMGLYVLMDQYKTSWIKQVFPDDKEVNDLYQCKEMYSDLSASSYSNCVNADDDRADDLGNLKEFLETINAASNRSEVEDIMDVDTFIQYWILEWLLGSGDHMLINGKNFYLYKQLNDIWTVLYYDFDSLFGVDLDKYYFDHNAGPEIPFEDWYVKRPIVDTLAKNDQESFLKNLQFILDNAFNPDIIFPHIDSIKNWIDPYMLEDRTPVNGTLPGRINKYGVGNDYSYEQFISNAEFESVDKSYGLKEWVQRRYNYVCENYDVECPNFEKEEITTSIEEITTKPVEDDEVDNNEANNFTGDNDDDEIITEGGSLDIEDDEIITEGGNLDIDDDDEDTTSDTNENIQAITENNTENIKSTETKNFMKTVKRKCIVKN